MLALLPRFYPPKLKVDVIAGAEASSCLLDEIKTKEFPLIVDLMCSRAYTFYHCLDTVTHSAPSPGSPVRDQIQKFLQTRTSGADPRNETFVQPVSYAELRTLLTSLPEVRKLGGLSDRYYVGYGTQRAFIAEVTSTSIRDPEIPEFDLDDGFFEGSSELQAAYKQWKSQNYEGAILH